MPIPFAIVYGLLFEKQDEQNSIILHVSQLQFT